MPRLDAPCDLTTTHEWPPSEHESPATDLMRFIRQDMNHVRTCQVLTLTYQVRSMYLYKSTAPVGTLWWVPDVAVFGRSTRPGRSDTSTQLPGFPWGGLHSAASNWECMWLVYIIPYEEYWTFSLIVWFFWFFFLLFFSPNDGLVVQSRYSYLIECSTEVSSVCQLHNTHTPPRPI